jgi:hypothetical protein
VRGVDDLPCTTAHWPWEGWGAATHARPAAAPRPVRKCASAQVRKCASAQVRKCASAQVRKCASAQVRKVAQAGANEDGRFKDGRFW